MDEATAENIWVDKVGLRNISPVKGLSHNPLDANHIHPLMAEHLLEETEENRCNIKEFQFSALAS